MGRTKTLMISMVALLVLNGAPAAAKDGFYLGVNVLFNDISGDLDTSANVEAGHGMGLHGGFGLNRYLAIEAGYWKTKHANRYSGSAADLEAGTIDIKINFPLVESHIEPYLLVGAGRYTIEQNRLSEDGKGGRIGIGMDIYLFPDISCNVGFTRNNVTFTRNSADLDGRITTMDFGITYHFI
ncbi:MAG: outer membrane beta-barrel protein [Nitrospirota bacterium]